MKPSLLNGPRALLLLLLLTPACAFHSTARDWNHRVSGDGYPVWYTETTKVAVKLFVVVPFIGDVGVPGMINELSAEIAMRGGDHMRIVQGGTENYWYGFPPLTWIFTPVVSQVNAEWRPHPVSLADYAARCSDEEAEAHAEKLEAQRERAEREAAARAAAKRAESKRNGTAAP